MREGRVPLPELDRQHRHAVAQLGDHCLAGHVRLEHLVHARDQPYVLVGQLLGGEQAVHYDVVGHFQDLDEALLLDWTVYALGEEEKYGRHWQLALAAKHKGNRLEGMGGDHIVIEGSGLHHHQVQGAQILLVDPLGGQAPQQGVQAHHADQGHVERVGALDTDVKQFPYFGQLLNVREVELLGDEVEDPEGFDCDAFGGLGVHLRLQEVYQIICGVRDQGQDEPGLVVEDYAEYDRKAMLLGPLAFSLHRKAHDPQQKALRGDGIIEGPAVEVAWAENALLPAHHQAVAEDEEPQQLLLSVESTLDEYTFLDDESQKFLGCP